MLGYTISCHHDVQLAFKCVSYSPTVVFSSVIYPILIICAYGLTLIFGCATMKTLHVMTAAKDKQDTKLYRCWFLRLHSVGSRQMECGCGAMVEWPWEGKMWVQKLFQYHVRHQKSHMEWLGLESGAPRWETRDYPSEPWHGTKYHYSF
jgi:hypothetical protein